MGRLILGALLLTVVWPAQSQSSEDYALMAATAYAAFQCSTLVDKTERPEDRQLLFNLGYERGKVFIVAMDNGEVEAEHVYRMVPIDFLDRLDPWASPNLPNVDFRLGAIWEHASTTMVQVLMRHSGGPQLASSVEFSNRNCGTLLLSAREELR